MMEKKWKIVFLTICALFVVSVISMIYIGFPGSGRRGECVMVNPMVCIGGEIYSSPGLFSQSPIVYRLWFKGKMSKSGEVCDIVSRVTKENYSKWMY